MKLSKKSREVGDRKGIVAMKEESEYIATIDIVSNMLHIAHGYRLTVEVVDSFGCFCKEGDRVYIAAIRALHEWDL